MCHGKRVPGNYFLKPYGRDAGMNDGKNPAIKKRLHRGGDLLWLSTLGINLVLAGAAGIVIGFYLDKWLKTQPVMTIFFFCIGTFAGFRQIYKEMRKLGSDNEKQHEQKP